jgi:iron complex transport system substrate-binding protein
MWLRLTIVACIGLAFACGAQPAAAEPPRRIVSLNLCADQILIDLVPPDRILALSHLAADPKVSAIADRVAGIHLTRGEAEIVLRLDPDLVIAGEFSTPATVSLLERMGRRVEKVPLASDIAGVRTLVLRLAQIVGEEARGAALVAEFDRRLAAAAPAEPQSHRPTALVYQVNGLASGRNSLANAVMRAAGFENLAARTRLGPGGQIALEALVASPPDVLVLTGPIDEYRTAVAANLRHPALRQLMTSRPSLILPWRQWLCGTPHLAAAVERLAVERIRFEAKGHRP